MTYEIEYLTDKDVAFITGMSRRYIQKMRLNGVGIPYCKIGRSVRYAYADVIEFMESRKVQTTPFKDKRRGARPLGRRR